MSPSTARNASPLKVIDDWNAGLPRAMFVTVAVMHVTRVVAPSLIALILGIIDCGLHAYFINICYTLELPVYMPMMQYYACSTAQCRINNLANVQLEQRFVKFCLLTRQISTQSNVKRIIYCNVSYSSLYLSSYRTICRSIRSVWLNQVSQQHDRTCANVIDECTNIRYNLMSCDNITSKEANDVACYMATA